MTIAVSAPGKIILMGEHAAVYGRPALVAALDRRLRARFIPEPAAAVAGDLQLRLVLPQLEVDERWSWRDLRDYAGERRQAWQRWSEDGHRRPFAEVLGDRPAHVVATAVGEALDHACCLPTVSGRLEVESQLPVGGGFGSSAAASAAVVVTVLTLLESPTDRGLIERLCLEVERRQHGTPSGVDGAAVTRGGVVWAERGHERLVVERVEVAHPAFFDRLRIAHSGRPAGTTGEVVAAVRRLRDIDPAGFDRALDEATLATRGLRADLESRAAAASIVKRWRQFAAWLDSIGVVPESVRRLVREVEAAGGGAKISGAGALAGSGGDGDSGAGSFLVYHPDPSQADRLARLPGLELLEVRLGAEGVRLDDPHRS